MNTDSIYSMRFARPERDSFIDTTTHAKGKVTWSTATDTTATIYWPPQLLIWGKNQIVTTYNNMMLFDQSGKKIWTKPFQAGTPVVVAQGYLYYKNKNLFLDAIDINEVKKLDSGPFPGGMSGDYNVEFLYPRKNNYLSVIFDNDQHDHQEGEESMPSQPTLNIIKNRYEITYGDWSRKIDANGHLPPLYNSENETLALWTSNFTLFDMKTEREILKVPLSMSGAVDWSVDQNEVYHLLAEEKTKLIVVALSSTGKEQWRCLLDPNPDKKSPESWLAHPPILNRNGKVFAMTNERLIAIEKGKKIWQYPLMTKKEQRSYASVLADDSLLVTNGKSLLYLDKKGNKIWSLELISEILSSPIVDKDGNIFVATTTELIRVN